MIRCRLSMCLLACLLLLATVPAWAGDVRFSGVLPNGALLQQKVESMQERRYRNVVRQHTDYSCGAAALATILRHAYHLQTDEATVIEGMMGVSDPALVAERGFSCSTSSATWNRWACVAGATASMKHDCAPFACRDWC